MLEVGDSSESTSEPNGQPVSGLNQSTLLEQSSVNPAILESLERLNYNFATFSENQYPGNDYSHEQVDEVGERSNDSSPVDIHQEVNAIVNPVNDAEDIESPQDTPRNDESDIVDYDSQLDLNLDTKGPKLMTKWLESLISYVYKELVKTKVKPWSNVIAHHKILIWSCLNVSQASGMKFRARPGSMI